MDTSKKEAFIVILLYPFPSIVSTFNVISDLSCRFLRIASVLLSVHLSNSNKIMQN